MVDRENRLLASFIADFKKGKKTADPMEYARTCRELLEIYGSTESVAEKLGIGKETVRILSKIVELPQEVQDMISKHRLRITVAFDLVPLSREKQIEAANVISGLSFKDARKVIRRISESRARAPATDIRADVLNELEKKEVDIAMIALPKEVFGFLQEKSENIPKLVIRIVEEWLVKDSPLDTGTFTNKGNNVSLMIRLPRRTFTALRRKTRKPANLVERIVISYYKDESKIS